MPNSNAVRSGYEENEVDEVIPPAKRLEFPDVVRLDPRIGQLQQEVKNAAHGRRQFCAVALWYGLYGAPWSVRGEVGRLVGWHRRSGPPELQTAQAYDTVVRQLYDEDLPDCRGVCGCNPE